MKTIVSSHIWGPFDGWQTGAVYTLEDGSRWQLVSAANTVKLKTRPRATVCESKGKYYLQVQGMGKKQQVVPLNRIVQAPAPGPIPKADSELAGWLIRAFEFEAALLSRNKSQ